MKSVSALVSKTFFILFFTLVSFAAVGETLPANNLILAGPASMVQNTCYPITLTRQGDYITSAYRERVHFSSGTLANPLFPPAIFLGNNCSGNPLRYVDIPDGQASVILSVQYGGYSGPSQPPIAVSLNAVSESRRYNPASLNLQILGPSLKLEGPSQMVQNTCYPITLTRQGDYITSAYRERVQFSSGTLANPLLPPAIFLGNNCSGNPLRYVDIPDGQDSMILSVQYGGYSGPSQPPIAVSLNAVSQSRRYNPASLNLQILGPSLKLEGPSQMVQNTCYPITLTRQGDYITSAYRERVQFSSGTLANPLFPPAIFLGNNCSGNPLRYVDIPDGQASVILSVQYGGPSQPPIAVSLNAVSESRRYNPASLNLQILGPSLKLEGPSQMVQNTCYPITLTRQGDLGSNYANTWVTLDYLYPFEISLDAQCSGSLARSVQIPVGQKSVTLSIKSKYSGSGTLKATASYGYAPANLPLQVR